MARECRWGPFLLVSILACGGSGGVGPRTLPEGDGGAYSLPEVASRLDALRARVESGDAGATRERAVTRAHLLLIAQLTRRASLVRTLARSFGPTSEKLCLPDPIPEGCLPSLYHLSGTELGEVEAAWSELFLSLSSGWNDRTGRVFEAIRDAQAAGRGASEAADALVVMLGTEIVRAVQRTLPAAAPFFFAEGLNLECPSAVGLLGEAPPEDRLRLLASAGCDASCPGVEHPLDCSPESLGVSTPEDRDFVAGNVPSWLVVRSFSRIVAARGRLEASSSPLARTLVRDGVLAELARLLEAVDVALSPPSAWRTESGIATLPVIPSVLPWEPSSLYVVVAPDGLRLGRAPHLWVADGAVHVGGTTMPGEPVAPEEEGELVLDGEPTRLSLAWDTLRGAEKVGTVVLFADAEASAHGVVSVAARFERELGVDVHLLLRGAHDVGVLRIPSLPDPTQGGGTTHASVRRLHLTEKGFRVSASSGQVTGEDTTDTAELARALGDVARGVPKDEPLQISVGEGVPYVRLVEAIHAAAGHPRAPFRVLRLAP